MEETPETPKLPGTGGDNLSDPPGGTWHDPPSPPEERQTWKPLPQHLDPYRADAARKDDAREADFTNRAPGERRLLTEPLPGEPAPRSASQESDRWCAGGHSFAPATKEPYEKPISSAVGVRFLVLYCTRCGATQEIPAQHLR